MTLSVRRDVSLRPYNTLRFDVQAREWVALRTEADCAALPALCRGKAVLILGGGSNLVLAGDIDALVIHNRLRGIECVRQDDDHVWVRVAGGENWDDVVAHAVAQGWHGVENLSAIPGTAGAAPVQNIGAYGVELKDVLDSVNVLHLQEGRSQTLTRDECGFGYRDSIFKSTLKHDCLITHIVLRLQRRPDLKLDYGEIRTAMAAAGLDETTLTAARLRQLIIEIRARKLPDPAQLPNVGSFFKNPVVQQDQLTHLQQRWPDLVSYPLGHGQVKIAAGWLLDRLGWKGRQWGTARVHERQALVLINQGDKSADLMALKNAMQADVRMQTGIELEVEPLIVGLDPDAN